MQFYLETNSRKKPKQKVRNEIGQKEVVKDI